MPETIKENFTCPKGHTFHHREFHSYWDSKKGVVTFFCPGGKLGHSFTIDQAVKSGMFTQEESERIMEAASKV